jgi:hypothetical protein
VSADDLKIGDLVQKVYGPRDGCLAVVTDLSMENYFQFIAWIKIVYADEYGGYEWVQRDGLRIVVDKD